MISDFTLVINNNDVAAIDWHDRSRKEKVIIKLIDGSQIIADWSFIARLKKLDIELNY